MNTSGGTPIEITIRNSGTLVSNGPPQVYRGGTSYYCPNGGNWCNGLGQPGFRGLNPSTGVWKVFFDLDQMTDEFGSGGTRNSTGPYLGTFQNTLTFSVSSGSTRAVVQGRGYSKYKKLECDSGFCFCEEKKRTSLNKKGGLRLLIPERQITRYSI